ncbi:MAG: class I adenylate-forming enzyme family protein, partial [Bryobacteraceae bacterium]
MRRETLLDFFRDIAQHEEEFVVYDDGYRSRTYTYAEVTNAAHAFSERLRASGFRKEDKVLIWSENRPEWLIALWGCLLEGVVVVPVDYRASADLLQRVHNVSQASLLLVGDEVPGAPLDTQTPVWRLSSMSGMNLPHPSESREAGRIDKDDIAEILFTSGATAEPKGVVITHRNVLANIVPVEREVLKYRKYSRPFAPIRFLNLLPLSHMFGQAMATFIPPMLPGTVVFMRGYNPAEIIRQIRSRRVSVLVCVPKILDVLREHVLRTFPEAVGPASDELHWILRWWRYRKIHRMFGFKFWSFVVGAAPLDPGLEEFWSRLGFLVIQGYGLTETAPIVSLNHPFRARRGTVGKPIAGVEVKISPEGEILVRGENVTSGYYNAKHETAEAFRDGWFHTGDRGPIDESGRLHIHGRKKEMIVTPEGLNVFPEDVEHVLNEQEGVQDSAIVAAAEGGKERVHAVLVLRNGADPNEIL